MGLLLRSMRRRFLINIAVSDTVSLVVGVLVASMLVFKTPLPWIAEPGVWATLVSLFVGAAIGAYVSARSHARSAPRPTYGRAVWMVGFALALTAGDDCGLQGIFLPSVSRCDCRPLVWTRLGP